VVNDNNDEDSESPLASKKTGRSKKRRVKDLSVCDYSVMHHYVSLLVHCSYNF